MYRPISNISVVFSIYSHMLVFHYTLIISPTKIALSPGCVYLGGGGGGGGKRPDIHVIYYSCMCVVFCKISIKYSASRKANKVFCIT